MNSEFMSAIIGGHDQDFGWIATFASDPAQAIPASWSGTAWVASDAQRSFLDGRGDANNYYCVSALKDTGGQRRRSKDTFSRLAVLLADDVDIDSLAGSPSYALETSPGKYQVGVFLDADDPDTRNLPLIDAVLHAMAFEGLISADKSGNNPVRYARLPQGSNTKKREGGVWKTRMLFCNPETVLGLADAVATFNLDLDALRGGLAKGAAQPKAKDPGTSAELVKAIINPNLNERSYHDPLLKISAGLIAGGLNPGATVNHLRSIMMASKPEDEGADLDRWRARFGDELPRLVRSADKFAPVPPVAPTPPKKLLETIAEVDLATGSIKWLVKGIIGADNLVVCFGASGTYKSFVMIDLAMSVAHGIEWAGRKTKSGPVVYVAAEGGGGLSKRIKGWSAACGVEPPENFYICREPIVMSEALQVAALRKEISELPVTPVLVVIDTLAQTFSGDENSSSDIGTYLRMINAEIRAAFACTVIVVHHTGHNATERPRGSSAITSNVDALIACFKEDSESASARLDVMKQKDGDLSKGLTFDMTIHDLGVDEDGDKITTLVAGFESASDRETRRLRDNKYDSIILTALANGKPHNQEEIRKQCAVVYNASARATYIGLKRAFDRLVKARLVRESAPGVWSLVPNSPPAETAKL